MPIPNHIREYLDAHEVRYQHCTHSPAYTAQGIAHAQHVSGKELAKVVMVLAGKRKIMAVVPGHHRVELERLGRLLKAKNARLATEEEFKDDFEDCELGAMPPFGNLYDMEVWVDDALEANPVITFNAGTHVETIRMPYEDFERLVKPKKGSFSSVRR